MLPALRTLAAVASFSAPLVVVFDQLENLVDDRGSTAAIHAHARLYSELHDTVPGLVLMQLSLDSEWERRISPALGLPEKSRLEARVLTPRAADAGPARRAGRGMDRPAAPAVCRGHSPSRAGGAGSTGPASRRAC